MKPLTSREELCQRGWCKLTGQEPNLSPSKVEKNDANVPQKNEGKMPPLVKQKRKEARVKVT